MKINRKGFTLIELLAVIVVLAIIALIATPLVLSAITRAQNGANARSVEGYMDAYESAYYQYILDNNGKEPGKSEDGTILDITDEDVDGYYSGADVTCTGIKKVNNDFSADNCTVNGQNFSYANGRATAKE